MVKTVIRFVGSWCGPCRVYAPIFHKVSEMKEFDGIEFADADVDEDENEELVEKYKIMGVPTTIVLDEDDNLLYKEHGIIMEDSLTFILNNLIQKENEK